MTITKSRPPLCRYCGNPIAKKTVRVHFVTGPRNPLTVDSKFERFLYVGERPIDIGAVRKLLPGLEVLNTRDHLGGDGIAIAFGWDGHSFHDLYFCNSDHAREFGYTAAISGLSSLAYQDAMKIRYQDFPKEPLDDRT